MKLNWKNITGTVVLGLSIAANARAAVVDGSPTENSGVSLSQECRDRSGTYDIKFHGQSFIAARLTYSMKITFPQGLTGLSYVSDWGSDVEEDVDTEALSNTWILDATTTPKQSMISCRATPERCLSSANNILTRIKITKKNALTGQPDKDAILNCAAERMNYFIAKVRAEVIQRLNVKNIP